MARKTAMHTIEADGRDRGKVFLITEMPSSQGESWAARAILALMANSAEIPEDFAQLGMAGLAELGLRALSNLKWDVLAPLLDEMMSCVQVIPDPRKVHVARALIEDDIEEIGTRLQLRKEWWALHMGFLQAVAPSMLGGAAADQRKPASATKTSRK